MVGLLGRAERTWKRTTTCYPHPVTGSFPAFSERRSSNSASTTLFEVRSNSISKQRKSFFGKGIAQVVGLSKAARIATATIKRDS